MNETNFREPWQLVRTMEARTNKIEPSVRDCKGGLVLISENEMLPFQTDMERIVACVNACRYFPTKVLEMVDHETFHLSLTSRQLPIPENLNG